MGIGEFITFATIFVTSATFLITLGFVIEGVIKKYDSGYILTESMIAFLSLFICLISIYIFVEEYTDKNDEQIEPTKEEQVQRLRDVPLNDTIDVTVDGKPYKVVVIKQ